MTYIRPHSRPRQRWVRRISIVLGAIILIVVLILWRVPNFFPGLVTSFARPFWRADFAIDDGSLKTPEALLSQNESLELQLSALQTSIASSSIEGIIEENADLKSLLGRASTTPYTAAAVLERPPFLSYDELILDVGTDDGVSSTTLVYAPGNILIGRISDAYSETSKAILFSSPGEQYPVLIGPTHIAGTAVGQGGGQYRAQVPHGSPIQPGDTVSDASFDDAPFGAVVSITTDAADPFDEVLFAPAINIYSLRWVLVGVKPKR